MKKILLILCLLLIYPVTGQASHYINHEHNFQITLPDGWSSIASPDSELPAVGIQSEVGIAGLVITIEELGFKETFDDFSAEDIKELSSDIGNALKKVQSNLVIQSTQLTYINGQQALVMRYYYTIEGSNTKITGIITNFAKNYQLYSLNLATNDTSLFYEEIYWQTCASFSFL